MTRTLQTNSGLAATLAPEDLRCGDFVALLNVTREVPSFAWQCGAEGLSPHELVQLQFRAPGAGIPLKVKALCLPFVLLKDPHGKPQLVDVRDTQLVRLSRDFARLAAKEIRQHAAPDPLAELLE